MYIYIYIYVCIIVCVYIYIYVRISDNLHTYIYIWFGVPMATDFLGSRFKSKKMMLLFFSFYIRSVREPKMS